MSGFGIQVKQMILILLALLLLGSVTVHVILSINISIYRSVCSKGSVVVNFNLWFNQPVDVKEAEEQLVSGLRNPGNGPLVVDINSILIAGRLLCG